MATTIFTLPVYPCDEQTFYAKWRDCLGGMACEWSDEQELIPQLMRISAPASVWKFNRAIGFVEINITKTDMFTEAYKMDSQKLGAIRMSRGTIRDLQLTGMHFRLDGLDNREIAEKAIDYAHDVGLTHFKGKYVDDGGFRKAAPFVDYIGLAAVSDSH